MGLEKADEGTVSGMEHQKISAIFQENRLFENLDAVTNIHITTGKTKEEITGFLKKMELDDIAGKPVSEYSGGMKRRVAIARALLAEYDIFGMGEVKVIIQRMNRNVFKQPEELMENIVNVTEFLKKKIEKNEGDPFKRNIKYYFFCLWKTILCRFAGRVLACI